MEKGAMASSSAASSVPCPLPTAPPSAPPSYEEAVGLTMGVGPMPVVAPVHGAPPYPMAAPMQLSTPYIAPAVQMPLPSQQQQQQQQHHQHQHHHQQQQQQHHHHTATGQAPQVRILSHDVAPSLGPNPIKMSCPSCYADIKTTTISDHQPSAHVCCIVLCLLGCCLCSCLPYCVSAFLRVHHICPNCKAYIGTWKG